MRLSSSRTSDFYELTYTPAALVMVQRAVNDMALGASLARDSGVASGSCVALIGGGGKTTAMYQMARELVAQGDRVLVTTTTKIWPPAGLPLVSRRYEADAEVALHLLFGRAPIVVLGEFIESSTGKLHGISPDVVCALHSGGCADVLLCEADGAAGRPLKAHRAGEPVVPGCSTIVAILAGIDAVGRPADAGVIHRPEVFADITKIDLTKIVEPAHVAELLMATTRYVPSAVQTVFVLNKVDDNRRLSAANRVVDELIRRGVRHRILLTRHGRVLARYAPAVSRSTGVD